MKLWDPGIHNFQKMQYYIQIYIKGSNGNTSTGQGINPRPPMGSPEIVIY